jgi:hypothetical protein
MRKVCMQHKLQSSALASSYTHSALASIVSTVLDLHEALLSNIQVDHLMCAKSCAGRRGERPLADCLKRPGLAGPQSCLLAVMRVASVGCEICPMLQTTQCLTPGRPSTYAYHCPVERDTTWLTRRAQSSARVSCDSCSEIASRSVQVED